MGSLVLSGVSRAAAVLEMNLHIGELINETLERIQKTRENDKRIISKIFCKLTKHILTLEKKLKWKVIV